MTFVIPGFLRSIRSDKMFNVRSHKVKNILVKKEQREWSAKIKLMGYVSPMQSIIGQCRAQGRKLKIRAIILRPRIHDHDQAETSLNKLIIDGFVDLGILPSDHPRILDKCVIDQVKCPMHGARVELNLEVSDQEAEW